MMQMNEIQQRFSDVRRAVDHATQACRTQQGIPEDLRECLQQLDQQTSQAQQVFQSQDENQIRQCIDDLEQLSDRAEQALEGASSIDGDLRNAIDEAHSQLSNLKRQLH
ncbi:MAG TPA: hypothetical protein VEC06_09655 [Paucimonas sp.]|nr:hypothetical protein [Paucimonas sp.]